MPGAPAPPPRLPPPTQPRPQPHNSSRARVDLLDRRREHATDRTDRRDDPKSSGPLIFMRRRSAFTLTAVMRAFFRRSLGAGVLAAAVAASAVAGPGSATPLPPIAAKKTN